MTRIVCLFLLLSTFPAFAQKAAMSALSSELLSPDRMTIYQDFVKGYTNGSSAPLNISEITVKFTPKNEDRKACLSLFGAADLSNTAIHTFAKDAFQQLSVRLVDPKKHRSKDPGDAIVHGKSVDAAVKDGFANALFTLSEIVFDASHTHAAFSFSFVCGHVCGNGGTVLYELQNGKWTQIENRCGAWIS